MTRTSVPGMLTRITAHLPAVRRALRRRRRTLATLLIALLAVAALPALLPPGSRGAAVVVAGQDLEPGTVLEPEHLRVVEVAADLVPTGSPTSPEELTGRVTVIPLAAGTPLLPGTLEDEGSPSIPEGDSLMAVTAPSVLAPHLRPGTGVEILHSAAGSGSTARTSATVLEVTSGATSAVAGVTGGGGEVVVLVTLSRSGAQDVAHATREGWSIVTVVG